MEIQIKPVTKYLNIEKCIENTYVYFSNKRFGRLITKQELDEECRLEYGIYSLKLEDLIEVNYEH